LTVCSWDDDGQDDHDTDTVHGAPNKQLSLAKARATFRAVDVGDERRRQFVRDSFPLKIHLSWTEVTATLTATWAADGILWLPERRGCAARVLTNLEFAEPGCRKMGI
jgi:hypothetical protein